MSPEMSGANWFWLIAPPVVFVVISFLHYFIFGKERGE